VKRFLLCPSSFEAMTIVSWPLAVSLQGGKEAREGKGREGRRRGLGNYQYTG